MILFLSERGWQGTRTCSLECGRSGVQCRVLIKGRPSREVREFITSYPQIKNVFIPRLLFMVVSFIYLLVKKLSRKKDVVIVERPRAIKLVQWLGLSYLKMQELNEKPFYELVDAQNKKITLQSVLADEHAG